MTATVPVRPAAPPQASGGLSLLREMTRIRFFEERCVELYSASRIRGFLHLCIGKEAVAVGVNTVLTEQDAVVATYREHGNALARGVPMDDVMAEMFGKVTGRSRRGGSMHLFDATRRFSDRSASRIRSGPNSSSRPRLTAKHPPYRPTVRGLLGVHPTVAATLSADHRASDGHVGGPFLAAIAELLDRPEDL